MAQNYFKHCRRFKTIFTVCVEVSEIYPDKWGKTITWDIPKINANVNIAGRLKVTAFGIPVVNREGTLCLR